MNHADKLDNATELNERERAHSEKNFKRPNHGLLPTGLCYRCECDLEEENKNEVFCSKRCEILWCNQ